MNKREQFYNDFEGAKAEFINGEIIMHSPVKKIHNDITKRLGRLLDVYCDKHQLGFLGVEKIMIALTRNDYEPDICFFKMDKAKDFEDDQTKFPAADLVIEILSKGTKKRDRGIKFQDYAEHQIEEYWIIDPLTKTVEQYHLTEGSYELILKSGDGEITSFTMEGFKIPIQAIFDKAINLKVLSKMLTK